MRKFILFVFPFLVIILGYFAYVFFLGKNAGRGALQVTATPDSTVYLNGRFIGKTPLCKCEQETMLPTGEYTVRLVPPDEEFTPFEEKITIQKAVLTVVNRSFGKGTTSEGSVISLTPLDDNKSVELLVASFPDRATVYVDNSVVGQTPLLLKTLTDSDHELLLAKSGYKEKSVRIRTVAGYKLTTIVFLGVGQTLSDVLPISTASATATGSAVPTQAAVRVTILATPIGYLRVRSDPSTTAAESGRVLPGESYELLGEKDAWYEIKLKDGKTGWISADYAKKQ